MEDSVYLQLHKLSPINSQETLDQLLTSLWNSRRTGLRSPDKSRFQSLLNLPSPADLDPVLACLRSLIRKSAHENFTGDDLLKLFPPDLALDLQSILVLLLQKYQNQWRDEISREQHTLPRTSVTYQLKTSVPTLLPSFDTSMLLWPRQGDINGCEMYAPQVASMIPSTSIQNDADPPENLSTLPRLKSMTWTMENCTSSPTNRVAIICLKLQGFNRSPSAEMEVKFQLTKDTLEAMLRSMTYINEQLSNTVRSTTEPAQKKHKS